MEKQWKTMEHLGKTNENPGKTHTKSKENPRNIQGKSPKIPEHEPFLKNTLFSSCSAFTRMD